MTNARTCVVIFVSMAVACGMSNAQVGQSQTSNPLKSSAVLDAASPTPTVGTSPIGPSNCGPPMTEELSRWTYFWRFRGDSYLRDEGVHYATHEVTNAPGRSRSPLQPLVGAIRRPSRAQVVHDILPQLYELLDATAHRELTLSILRAFAKIGIEDPRSTRMLRTVRRYLASRDAEVQETAALTMGAIRCGAAIPDLIALLHDDPHGRALCGRAGVQAMEAYSPALSSTEASHSSAIVVERSPGMLARHEGTAPPESGVPNRTRAIAAYALGLVANASERADDKREILGALQSALVRIEVGTGIEMPVAIVHAIGLLRPDADDATSVRRDALATLWDFYDAPIVRSLRTAQAQVPTAAARLLASETDDGVRLIWTRRFVEQLRSQAYGCVARDVGWYSSLARPAADALGDLAEPHELGSPDAWISDALYAAFVECMDDPTRNIALASLGRIGGTQNRARLLHAMNKHTSHMHVPWAAIGLGLSEHRRFVGDPDAHEPDSEVVAALLAQFARIRHPELRGAIAIALGLCRARAAAPVLRAELAHPRRIANYPGHLCLALGMLGDAESTDLIRDLVRQYDGRYRERSPYVTALRMLGDESDSIERLRCFMTRYGDTLGHCFAVGVGVVGDRSTIRPLLELVHDASSSDLDRAAAVVALGGIAADETRPWHASIARHVNYFAAEGTMLDLSGGIFAHRE